MASEAALHQLHLLPMRKCIGMENPEVESENYGHEFPLLHNPYLGVFNSYAWLYMKMLNSLTAEGYNDFLQEIGLSVFEQMLLEGKGWKKMQLPTYLTLLKRG